EYLPGNTWEATLPVDDGQPKISRPGAADNAGDRTWGRGPPGVSAGVMERMPDSGKSVGEADWNALARYVAGESSPAEAEAIREWLSEDPERQEILDSLVRSLAALAYRPPADLDVESALCRAKAILEAEAGGELAGVGAA